MLKFTEKLYETFEFFDTDDLTKLIAQKVVRTRQNHDCQSGLFDAHPFVKGTLAVRETAIVEELGFRTNYICIDCADKILGKYFYYVDCINACRANPDDAKPNGEDVFCPECGESGVVYDLRETQPFESTVADDTIPPAPKGTRVSK